MPPHSASISWLAGMIERANEEVENFKFLELPIQESEEAQRMLKKADELITILTQYKDKTNEDWKALMEKDACDYLEEYIVRREDLSTISISFSNEVLRTFPTFFLS